MIRITFWMGIVVVCCTAIAAEELPVAPWRDARPAHTAVIDVDRLISRADRSNVPGLVDAEEELNKEVATWNEALQTRKAELETQRVKLVEYRLNSARWRRENDAIALEERALTTEDEKRQADFAQRRSGLQAAIVSEVRQHAAAFAKKYRIAMILMYHDREPHADDSAAAKRLFEREVVYQNKIDITFDILDAMKAPKK
jgi:Skp family chaperone for outer membrane proteins